MSREVSGLIALAMVLIAMVTYGIALRVTSGVSVLCDSQCTELLDLQAQQSMATAAWWMFGATLVATVLSAGALFALVTSLRQTRRVIQDTREIGEHQTQAYVHAADLVGKQTSGLILTVANTGLTPSSHFSLNYTAQVVSRGRVFSQYHFRRDNFVTYSALGPGEKLSVGLNVPRSALSKEGLFLRGGDILLITGTIIYSTVFNHDYETQFVFFGRPTKDGLYFQRSPANLRTFNRLDHLGLMPSQYTPEGPVIDISEDTDAAQSP